MPSCPFTDKTSVTKLAMDAIPWRGGLVFDPSPTYFMGLLRELFLFFAGAGSFLYIRAANLQHYLTYRGG